MNKTPSKIEKKENQKEKDDLDFLEMVDEYKKETARIEKEKELLKKKEEEEFLQLVYESGIPVYLNNKITILDKKTNTIIDISKTDISNL